MKVDWHPSLPELSQFISLEESSEINERISAHLDGCQGCREALTRLNDYCVGLSHRESMPNESSNANSLVERVFSEVDRVTFPTSYPTLLGSQELTFDRYLDHGGMGDVLVFDDNQLSRKVVVKTLRHDKTVTPEKVFRFRQEYLVTSSLNIPGVADVYHRGKLPDGREFFSMRYVDGENLHTNIQSRHGKGIRFLRNDSNAMELLRIFASVCKTIHAAHAKKIVHRDLKSKNVLLDKNHNPFVVDWGFAGILKSTVCENHDNDHERLSKFGSAMGTPDSWAPEQAIGDIENLDDLTDVYGLGAILFEILANVPLHSKSHQRTGSTGTYTDASDPRLEVQRIKNELLAGTVRNPKHHRKDLPNELVSISLRATNPIRSQRYRSANELAEDVEAWLSGLPVRAHRYSSFERIQRWVASSPIIVATVLVCFTAIGVISFGFANYNQFLLMQSTKSREVAEASITENITTLDSIMKMASDVSRPETDELQQVRTEMVTLIEQGLHRATGKIVDEKAVVASSKLLNRLGQIYLDNGELQKAINVREFALSNLRKVRQSKDSQLDRKLVTVELLTDLTNSQILRRDYSNGIKTSEEARRVVDSIDQSDLLSVSKVALPVSVRRMIAQSFYRNWAEETLTAHDQALETHRLCSELLLIHPNDLELKVEEVQLLAFLGLCVHKSGKFRLEMENRYPTFVTENGDRISVAQDYFMRSIEAFEQLPVEFRDSDRGLSLLLNILERRGLSDQYVQREKAIATFDQAIEIGRDFVNRFPLSREHRIHLASLLNSQADQFYKVDMDRAIQLRTEGKAILQNQIHTAKERIAAVFTLNSARLARDLFLQSEKDRAVAIYREVFDLFGTLHNGEPLTSEFLGYALLYEDPAIGNDPRLQSKIIELALAYLETAQVPLHKRTPELFEAITQIPECGAFCKLEPILTKLSELGFE